MSERRNHAWRALTDNHGEREAEEPNIEPPETSPSEVQGHGPADNLRHIRKDAAASFVLSHALTGPTIKLPMYATQ